MKTVGRIALTSILTASLSVSAFALGSGGFSDPVTASARTIATGLAFAGVADDPSANYVNPSGLTNVKGVGLMYGGSLIDLSSEHTTPSGQTDKMERNLAVAPYLYATYSKTDNPWAFGIGVNSPFGLITQWKDDSFSKYYATKSQLLMYQINPNVAYAVNEHLSFGGGIDYVDLYNVELNQRVVNFDFSLNPTANDGKARFKGDGTGWGYDASMLWKLNERHSFGVAYRSQINVIVDGNTSASDLTGATAFAFGGSSFQSSSRTEVKLPQSWLFGYGFKPTDRVTVFADYEWAGWSADNETHFDYQNNNALLPQTIRRKWRDTNNVGAGVEWKTNDILDLRAGALAYERVTPNSTLESSIPDTGRWALSFGPGLHFGDTRIDLAYMAIFFQHVTVNNDAGNAFASMDGKFKSFINVFGLGFSHRWGAKAA